MCPLRRSRAAAGLLLGLALGITAAAPAPGQDEAAQTRDELRALTREIARITAAQREREEKAGGLRSELRQSERSLSALRSQLKELQTSIGENRQQIAALETRRAALAEAAEAQQTAVAEEIRRAYQGGDEPLQLLLSQDDPQAVARLLAYFRYVLGARSAILDEYRATREELQAVTAEALGRERDLGAQQAQLESRRGDLQRAQARRRELLAAVEAEYERAGAALAERERDREQLEALLSEIEARLAAADLAGSGQPFSAAAGQLPWPVDGRITHRFGHARNQGKMRWQGVRMRAEAGTPVRAIHGGRVVYADWLRGSGLLLVIDHGEGYLSLYAHNESLLREVGDWVSTGSPISTVGDSGGQSEAALYFEIRKDGKPVDPARWCRG